MFIYRLFINDTTIYVGKCNNIKQRFRNHKYQCFNEKYNYYNTYKYLTIRQLNITKDNFYEYIRIEILYENIPNDYSKKMEQLIMCLYRDFGSNLWNSVKANFDIKEYENTDKIKEYRKDYHKSDKIKEYNKEYYLKNKK